MASRYNYVLNSGDMNQWEMANASATSRVPVPAGLGVFQNLTGLNTGTNRVAASELSVGANNICVSAIAIHNTTNWVLINMYSPDYSKSANAWFNVNTGVLGTLNYSGGLTGWTHAIFINPGGIGWEIRMYGAIDSTGWHLEVRPVDGDAVHESTAGNSVGIGGWQVELGTVRTTYKPTTTAVVTRTLTSVAVSNSYNTLYIGNTMPVTVTLLDDTGAPWDQEATITMDSSATGAATISAVSGATNGSGTTTATVTPVAIGSTNITALAGGITSATFLVNVLAAVITRPPGLLLLGAGGSAYPSAPPGPPPPPPAPTYNFFVNEMLDFNDEIPLMGTEVFPTPVAGYRWCGGFVNYEYAGGGSSHNMIVNVAPVADTDGSEIVYSAAPNSKLVLRYMVQYKSVSPFTEWTSVSFCDSKDDWYTADWYDKRGLNTDINPSTGVGYTVVQRDTATPEVGGYSVLMDLFREDPHCVLRHYNNITSVGNVANDGVSAYSIQIQISKQLVDTGEADDRANIQVCANVSSDWNTGDAFMQSSFRVVPDDGTWLRIAATNVDVNKTGTYDYCYNYDGGVISTAQLDATPPPYDIPTSPPPNPTPPPTGTHQDFLYTGLRDMRKDPTSGTYTYEQSYALNDAQTRLRTESNPSSQHTRAQLSMGRWGTQQAWDSNYNLDYDIDVSWVGQDIRDVPYWPKLVGWDQLYQSEDNDGEHLPGFVDNTRVVTYDKELWVRLISSGEWTRIATGGALNGETWRPNFQDYGGSFWGGSYSRVNDSIVDIKHETAQSGTSVRTNPSSGPDRYWVPHTYYGWVTVDPYDIDAVCSFGKASLILHDQNGTDDRDYSQYLYALGADWYPLYDGPFQPGVGTSRSKYVTAKWPDWQYHVMHTMSWNDFNASHPPVVPPPPPPPPTPPAAVITPPSITSADKYIGTDMTRTVGTYDTGWAPVSGEWTVYGSDPKIVLGAQGVCPSVGLSPGQYALYTETIAKTGETSIEVPSEAYGPWETNPVPPPPPPTPGGGSEYLVSAITAAMGTANDNEHHLRNASNTSNNNGPSNPTRYAYVNQGIHSSYANAPYTGYYLNFNNATPGGAAYNTEGISIQAWYVIGISAQSDRNIYAVTNTRVQMRNFNTYALRQNNTWELLGRTDNPIGDYKMSWHRTFAQPGQEEFESQNPTTDVRSEATNGGGESMLCPNSGATGGSPAFTISDVTAHGFPYRITKQYQEWRNYKGFIQFFEARLILNNTSGDDDRDNADLMVWPGHDLYRDSSQEANNWANEWDHGRLRYLTNNWKTFITCSVLPADYNNNPPPGFSIS